MVEQANGAAAAADPAPAGAQHGAPKNPSPVLEALEGEHFDVHRIEGEQQQHPHEPSASEVNASPAGDEAGGKGEDDDDANGAELRQDSSYSSGSSDDSGSRQRHRGSERHRDSGKGDGRGGTSRERKDGSDARGHKSSRSKRGSERGGKSKRRRKSSRDRDRSRSRHRRGSSSSSRERGKRKRSSGSPKHRRRSRSHSRRRGSPSPHRRFGRGPSPPFRRPLSPPGRRGGFGMPPPGYRGPPYGPPPPRWGGRPGSPPPYGRPYDDPWGPRGPPPGRGGPMPRGRSPPRYWDEPGFDRRMPRGGFPYSPPRRGGAGPNSRPLSPPAGSGRPLSPPRGGSSSYPGPGQAYGAASYQGAAGRRSPPPGSGFRSHSPGARRWTPSPERRALAQGLSNGAAAAAAAAGGGAAASGWDAREAGSVGAEWSARSGWDKPSFPVVDPKGDDCRAYRDKGWDAREAARERDAYPARSTEPRGSGWSSPVGPDSHARGGGAYSAPDPADQRRDVAPAAQPQQQQAQQHAEPAARAADARPAGSGGGSRGGSGPGAHMDARAKQEAMEAANMRGGVAQEAKCWYYIDPQGRTQGPCSLAQFGQWIEHLSRNTDLTVEYEQFKTVSVWKDGASCRVSLMALLHTPFSPSPPGTPATELGMAGS